MDINRRLRTILLRHGIIEKASIQKVMNTLSQLEEKYAEGKQVALYGIGFECESLLPFINKHARKLRINQCYDKNRREYGFGTIVPRQYVYPIEEIMKKRPDIVIIGAREKGNDLKNRLYELSFRGEIVDLFDILNDHISNSFSDYLAIHTTKRLFREGLIRKEEALRKLIMQSFLIRDFISAKSYVDEYYKVDPVTGEEYIKAWEEIESLLFDIKQYVKNRNTRDVIINWVDAVSANDLRGFPFLNQISEEGFVFENAYTVMPWTSETMKTLLYGGYVIEDELYDVENYKEKPSRLREYLSERGYRIAYCGLPRIARRFWDDTICINHIVESRNMPSTIKQWDAVSLLCRIKEPLFLIIHNLYETHEPFVSADGDTCIKYTSAKSEWAKPGLKRQSKCADRYIDRQLAFYHDLYQDTKIRVYMSDHGRVGNSPMNDDKIHTFLMAEGYGVPAGREKGLFSYVHLWEYLRNLIDERYDTADLVSDHVIIENLDTYNENIVRNAINGTIVQEEMLQCRGVVTKLDKYYRYFNGKEYYFRHDDESLNVIDDEKHTKRISELRTICGDAFVDIYTNGKFKFSRALYDSRYLELID